MYDKERDAQITFRNLEVSGANGIELDNLEIRLKEYRGDFTCSIPVIDSEVDFEAELVMSNIIPVSYKGHLRAILKGIRIVGAANAKKKSHIGAKMFQLVSLHTKAHVEDTRVYLDYALGKSVDLIDKSALGAVQNEIALAATRVIMRVINEALTGYSVETVLKILLKENPY